MAETLKGVVKRLTGTGDVTLLEASGSVEYTILSITLCNQTTTDRTFSLWVNDADNQSGIGANTDIYLYKDQSLPAKATFEHTSKLILSSGANDIVADLDASGTVDVIVSYLEQT
tara:strand:- start:571 stop:915 length:345 start_codon:yes stop_codon:yes gene_type:complete